MKVVFILLIIILIIILLLLLPLKCTAMFVVDTNNKCIFFSLRLRKMNLSCGKIFLLDDLTLSTSTKTQTFMQLKQPKLLTYYFVTKLFSLLKIKELIILTDIGVVDAFTSSMIVAGLKAFVGSILATKSKKIKNSKISFKPIYNSTSLNATCSATITLNAFKILYALIYSKVKYKNKKGEKVYAKAN